MKKALSLMIAVLSMTATAQTITTENPIRQQYKTFSVIGDSYSTFVGKTEPATNAQFYPREGIDVYEASQTWWMLFQRETGVQLSQNNSWSGGTICNTWWNGADASTVSFVYRSQNLRKADLIIIEGGTNDSNAGSPIGSYKYSDWTAQDLKAFRPALAKTIDYLQNKYPEAKLVFMLNNGLKTEINSSVNTICEHYGVPVLALSGVAKALDHPTYDGMRTISRQLAGILLDESDYLFYNEYSNISIRRPVENAKVFFQFPIHEGQWTTACLPFSLNAEQVEQVFGEGAVVAEYSGEAVIDSDDPTKATVSFRKVDHMDLSKPYLVKPTITRTEGITIKDFTLEQTTPKTVQGADFSFVGSYRNTVIRYDNDIAFVMQPDGTMTHPALDITLGSMHAYIKAPKDIRTVSVEIED